MAVRKCANGHQYDASIYGEQCPFCPAEKRTRLDSSDAGSTRLDDNSSTSATEAWTDPVQQAGGGRTVIRRKDGATNKDGGRLLVGILVSYDVNPNGEAYGIYEGKTLIGRAPGCTLPFPTDQYMSGEHLEILFREAEGKFWAIDKNSTSGTYINGKFEGDKKEIHTNDVIVIGKTRFIFLAIPKS